MASLITTLNSPISSSSLLRVSNYKTEIKAITRTTTPLFPPLFPSALSFSISSPPSSSYGLAQVKTNEMKRGRVVVTRAGLSTTNLIFAFVFPLSLLLFTIFTSIRIADKLDEDFLKELATNQAMMEEADEDEDKDNPTFVVEKPALPRIRNRPKREA